jgi:hypothetical protein
MEWWQYYSIVSYILFALIMLVVISGLLLGLFVRAVSVVAPEKTTIENGKTQADATVTESEPGLSKSDNS